MITQKQLLVMASRDVGQKTITKGKVFGCDRSVADILQWAVENSFSTFTVKVEEITPWPCPYIRCRECKCPK